MTQTRSRTWCLTVNNYTDTDYSNLLDTICEYVIVGKETGESGTPHLQVYIYFKNAISFSSMKKKYPTAHIEITKGTPQQAADYCKKDGQFQENGQLPQSGKRTDLDEVRQLIKDGKGMKEIVNITSSYQSVKMAEQILKYNEPTRKWKPKVLWFHGSTGTGKTKQAYEDLGEDCYTCLSTGRWFDGYDAHENVLIDDMRKDFLKFHELLRLLDRYAMRIETKGGTRQFLAKNIIITSAYHPSILYETREDIQQLIRRIDEISERESG
jgi:predicted ATPase